MSTKDIRMGRTLRQTVPAEPARSASLATFFAAAVRAKRLLAGCIRRRALQRAERELMALDERMLGAVGLSRSEVDAVLRQAMPAR